MRHCTKIQPKKQKKSLPEYAIYYDNFKIKLQINLQS